MRVLGPETGPQRLKIVISGREPENRQKIPQKIIERIEVQCPQFLNVPQARIIRAPVAF